MAPNAQIIIGGTVVHTHMSKIFRCFLPHSFQMYAFNVKSDQCASTTTGTCANFKREQLRLALPDSDSNLRVYYLVRKKSISPDQPQGLQQH